MGGMCQRRASAEEDAAAPEPAAGEPEPAGPFAGRDRSEAAASEDKALADRLCQRLVLSYSRVARETIMACYSIGDLDDYVHDLRAREDQLHGFDGERDR